MTVTSKKLGINLGGGANGEPVFLSEVEPRGTGQLLGLHKGDVVVAINDRYLGCDLGPGSGSGSGPGSESGSGFRVSVRVRVRIRVTDGTADIFLDKMIAFGCPHFSLAQTPISERS